LTGTLYKNFWHNIRKNKNLWLPSLVGVVTGNEAIAEMWKKLCGTSFTQQKTEKLRRSTAKFKQ